MLEIKFRKVESEFICSIFDKQTPSILIKTWENFSVWGWGGGGEGWFFGKILMCVKKRRERKRR